jgi:lipocalin
LAGAFFTEGSFTKNTPEEVQAMMQHLQQWSSAATRPSRRECLAATAAQRPLPPSSKPLDLPSFMGTWYVLANIPTRGEVNKTNCSDNYALDEKREHAVKVEFESFSVSHSHSSAGTPSEAADPAAGETLSAFTMKMRATIKNPGLNTVWSNNPCVLGVPVPLGLTSLVVDCAADYSHCVVAMPDRSHLWVMIRATPSEYRPQGVPVHTAYPELGTAPPAGQVASDADAASPLPVVSKGGIKAGDVSVTVAGGVDGTVADAQASGEAAKRVYEVAVLRHALGIVAELGVDVSKVLRSPWRNEAPPKVNLK